MNEPGKRIDKGHRGTKIIGAWMCVDGICTLVDSAFRFSHGYLDIAVFSLTFVAIIATAIWLFRR